MASEPARVLEVGKRTSRTSTPVIVMSTERHGSVRGAVDSGSLAGMPDDFSVRPELRESSLEVAVAGDLDMAAAFRLESAVEPLLAAADVPALVVDLADVRFVDSAGLGALLAIRERARDAGIPVSFARSSEPVRRILTLTGLQDVLDG